MVSKVIKCITRPCPNHTRPGREIILIEQWNLGEWMRELTNRNFDVYHRPIHHIWTLFALNSFSEQNKSDCCMSSKVYLPVRHSLFLDQSFVVPAFFLAFLICSFASGRSWDVHTRLCVLISINVTRKITRKSGANGLLGLYIYVHIYIYFFLYIHICICILHAHNPFIGNLEVQIKRHQIKGWRH